MASKKILIAAANYWTSPYHVGSHHYAKIFAKNNWEVLFVSDPVSPFHFFTGNKGQVNERYKIYRGSVESGYKNINIYVPFSLFTPNEKFFFKTRFVANNWHKFTFPNIVSYAKKLGFGDIDILWFDSISQFFWLDAIKHKKSIYRIADKMDSFRKISNNLKILEQSLKDKCDFIFYTAKTLESFIEPQYKEKSRYIPNGVDFEHFDLCDANIPKEFEKISKPIAIYVGAIEEWFGVDLLYEVAKKCSDVSFVIIGNPNINISRLENMKNIYFLGKKNYSDVPSYMKNSDVGIITFNIKHPVVRTVNPIKLYEYFACGLPVVATKWDELERLSTPAFLADNPDSFSNYIYEAIKEGKSKKYIDFARKNSWEARFEEIIRIYNKNENNNL